MVVGSRPSLERIVQIQKQQTELLKLKLLRISTQIEEQRFQIRQFRHSIDDSSKNAPASAWSLETRSLWLQRTQQQIADCRNNIGQLNFERQAVEAERQQIESRAEATKKLVDERLQTERRERNRVAQIELDEVVSQRGTGDQR